MESHFAKFNTRQSFLLYGILDDRILGVHLNKINSYVIPWTKNFYTILRKENTIDSYTMIISLLHNFLGLNIPLQRVCDINPLRVYSVILIP